MSALPPLYSSSNPPSGYVSREQAYATVMRQRQGFQDALKNRKISKSDYDKAMAYTDTQLANLNKPIPQRNLPLPSPSTPNTNRATPISTIGAFLADPIGIMGNVVNVTSKVTAKDKSPLGTFVNAEVGAAGFYVVAGSQARTTLANLVSGKGLGVMPKTIVPFPVNPNPNPNRPYTFTPRNQAQEIGYKGAEIGSAIEIAAVAPVLGPMVGVSVSSVLIGEGLSVGINQVFKGVQSHFSIAQIEEENKIFAEAFKAEKITPSRYKEVMIFQEQRKQEASNFWLTPEEIAWGAAEGGAFSLVGGGVFRGVAKFAPVIVKSRIGRTGIGAGLGFGGGYVLSGGNLEEAGKGALLGAGITLGTELFGVPLYNKIRSKLPSRYGDIRLTPGDPTIGASGKEVQTYVSDPLKELGGKRLRIVADVTEFPVGFKGVTTKSMLNEYLGRNVPTAHSTLTPEFFNLKAGGETLLKGYPKMGKGFRRSQQLYPFYSAPGSEEFVTVYGGYAGIGKGYSGSSTKIVFNGKATALVTLDTVITPEFLRLPNESQSAFLNRISLLSGRTGIAPETLLGYSMERQFITPTSYERFGVKLPGSLFISEGKIGTFQIKTLPTGRLGKIPIIRDMFADYTSLNVAKGHYAPVKTGKISSTAKILDATRYAESYGRTTVLSSPVSVGLLPSNTIVNVSKEIKRINQKSSLSLGSKPSKGSQLSSYSPIKSNSRSSVSSNYPSVSSTSTSKYPSKGKSLVPSLVPSKVTSSPSKPSTSNYPSPSRPHYPSHTPYTPFTQSSLRFRNPLFPSLGSGGKGKGGFDALKGRWIKQRNPVKTYGAMLKTFGIKTPKVIRKIDRATQKIETHGFKRFIQGTKKKKRRGKR